MVSVAIVLGLIIGSVNIANYSNVKRSGEMRLDMLENGGGLAPMVELFGNKRNPLSPEAPFESRFFTVIVDNNGNILGTKTDHIAAIGKEEAAEIASELFRKGKTEGIKDRYAFRALTGDGVITYIFIDHSRELDTFYSFLYSSILISAAAFILVFIFVLIFSKIAIKPIAESYEKQKRFITDAGHELKTPLTVIRAANEVLEIENGENQWTKSIENQVKNLTELTNKLVILSRMSEEQGLHFSELCLSDMLSECIDGFEAVGFSEDKEIISSIESNIKFRGDEKAIAQLFSVLTDNALKYSPKGSIIDISLKKSGKYTEIIFLNPAENIPVGDNSVLFERFYRHDESRNSEKGGHGIGLAAAKAIVEAHKGKISAESPDGKSFIVKILL